MKNSFPFILFVLILSVNIYAQGPGEIYNWENHKINKVNEEPWRSSFIPLSRPEQVFHKQRKSDFYKSLNGKWKFKYSSDFDIKPVNFYEVSYDDSAWDYIDVPRSWETAGYGIPIIANNGFMMEKNPPFIESKYTEGREVGSYRTVFTIPKGWGDKEVFINFSGVETAFWFWINGEKVGYSEDSRTNSEFNITNYLVEGENSLSVEVYRLSDGAYLEDQDAWRLSGIYRDVYLVAKSEIHIRDFFIQTELDSNYENASCSIDFEVNNLTGEEVQDLQLATKILDNLGNEIASNTLRLGNISSMSLTQMTTSLEVEKPELWSSEFPNLYYALFELIDEQGTVIDLAGTHVGFRQIEVKERQVFLNGKSILFKGVNRVEHDPDFGKYVPLENTIRDIELMKRHNINCIRTAHAPADPIFYDLCDRYGIWVIDEANVESHGFEFYDNRIANDTSWIQAHLERLEAMIQRDKNHPSVVMWSLGNEASISQTFVDMDNQAHKLDATRPTHYHFSDSTGVFDILGGANKWLYQDGNFEGPNRYLSLESLESIAKYPDDRPFLMNEYAHASGNSLGNLPEYVAMFEKYPGLVGGCIWDWIDQGLNRTDEHGNTYSACGYDFSNYTTTHCFDGIIFSDRSVSAKLIEVKGAYQNIQFDIVSSVPLKLELKNYHRFSDLSEYYLSWELLENGVVVTTGKIDNIITRPLNTLQFMPDLEVDFSSKNEFVINLSVRQKENTLWAKKDFEVASGYFALTNWKYEYPGEEKIKKLNITESPDLLRIESEGFEVGFDRSNGQLVSYLLGHEQLIERGLLPNFFRAPTTNDNDYKFLEKYLAKNWSKAGLANLHSTLESFKWKENIQGNVMITVESMFQSDSLDAGFNCKIRYDIYPDGEIHISVNINTFGDMPEDLPRIGMQLALKEGIDNFSWYGNGPYASYVDRKSGVLPGIYSGSVQEQWEGFPQPQDNGNKSDVRWFKLTNKRGGGLQFIGDLLLDVSVSHYEQLEVAEAMRSTELVKKDYVLVNIDYRNGPLHNLSCCGPDLGPLEKYRLKPGDFAYSFWIVPVR